MLMSSDLLGTALRSPQCQTVRSCCELGLSCGEIHHEGKLPTVLEDLCFETSHDAVSHSFHQEGILNVGTLLSPPQL